MTIFRFSPNSDDGVMDQRYYWEMPTGKALSDDTIIQQDEGETSSSSSSVASKSNYENLPRHLKSCFDNIYIILNAWGYEKGKVVRLLLAQGLIQEKPGEIMEDIAANIIQDLIGLGMLQEQYDYHGSTFLIPNIILEQSCVAEVQEHDFVAKAANSPIYASITNNGKYLTPNLNALPIRSLFARALEPLSSCSYQFAHFSELYLQAVSALQFLMVLDLHGLTDYLPDEVGDLVHLRYLGLTNSDIKKLPRTIGNLQNLQTFEANITRLRQLPIEILNIKQLRHLLLCDFHPYVDAVTVPRGIGKRPLLLSYFDKYGYAVRVPRGIGTLGNLQTCAGVYGDAGFAGELSTLTHLRNLDVRNVSEDYASELFAAIFKLHNLVSLSLTAGNPNEDALLPELEPLSPPPHLQELKLNGGLIEFPSWLASIENLTSIELRESNFRENPSSVLQFLPKLKHLVLDEAYKAKIIGKEFCEAGGYPELETLEIVSRDLVEWTEIVEGAFPSLKILRLNYCFNLRFLPEGLQHISTIQELDIWNSHGDLARRLKSEENYKIKHISYVRII